MLKRFLQRWTTGLPHRWRPFAALAGSPDAQLLIEEAGKTFSVSGPHFHGPSAQTAAPVPAVTEPTRRLFLLPNAGVYGDSGAVYDVSSRTFVEETLDDWHDRNHWARTLAAPRFPAARKLAGSTFLASTVGGQSFYHFLLDALPKLLWARTRLGACDRILLNDGAEGAKLRWLRFFGIEQPVIFHGALSHFHCERLLFTSRCVAHFTPNPWVVGLLRDAIGAQDCRPADPQVSQSSIWFDRREAAARQVTWEDALLREVPMLQPVNFGALNPEQVIRVCRESRVLAGFHGAAFANLVFCPAGVRSIELCFGQVYQPWYGRLAALVGADHHVVMLDPHCDPQLAAENALRELMPA